MTRKFLTLLPVAGVIALGVGACGDDDDQASTSPPAAGDPQVTFSSPGAGTTIGPNFTAKVAIEDFELDAKAVGKNAVEGHGHVHFSLDGGKFDSARYSGANGKLAEQLGTDGKYSPAVTPEITYKGIPAGKHTLDVDLANNDHSDSDTKSRVTFTVAATTYGAKTGAHGEKVAIDRVRTTTDGFTARVALTNFRLDAKSVGSKPVAGRGHLHFQLDGGKYDRPRYSGANGKLAVQLGTDGKYSPAVAPTITYKNLPKGNHVLKVYVANNDHSESGAVAQRTVIVG